MTNEETTAANAAQDAPERKPGDLARLAARQEAERNKPAEMETILGLPVPITLNGQEVLVHKIPFKRMRRFNLAWGQLGGFGMMIVAGNDPEKIKRINRLVGGLEGMDELAPEDLELAMTAASIQLADEQFDAMLEIMDLLLNGPTETYTREDLEEMLSLETFTAVLQAGLEASGIRPWTPPGRASR